MQIVMLTSTQIFDPSQDVFTDGPSMITGHWVATAAPTANGKILIIGGNNNDTDGIDNVEVYDSVTNSFTAGTPMSDPRLFATATLLPNGRVLIAGGVNGQQTLSRVRNLHALIPAETQGRDRGRLDRPSARP